MKICFLMPYHWTRALGGAELQVKYIMEYLRRNSSHEVVMVCRESAVESDEGIPVYRAKAAWGIGRYSHIAECFSVRRLLRRLSPDVVYTRTSTPLVGFAADYCRRYKKKLIYHIAHVNDVSPRRPGGRRYVIDLIDQAVYDYGLRRADLIVAQAHYQANLLEVNYGLSASAVIPNFQPIPAVTCKNGGPKKVLWIANLKPAKRPEVFFELARHCQDLPDTQFVMIGADPGRKYSGLLVKGSRLNNFVYLGKQTVEEVQSHFASAHLFVNTSITEGFPNTFIQSWLNGVPVVSLEFDPDGVLKNTSLGATCGGSLQQFEETVRDLLSDPMRLGLMSCSAREFAVANYSQDNCRRLLALIEEAAP